VYRPILNSLGYKNVEDRFCLAILIFARALPFVSFQVDRVAIRKRFLESEERVKFIFQSIAKSVPELFEEIRGGIFEILDVNRVGLRIGCEIKVGGWGFGKARPIKDEPGLEEKKVACFCRQREKSEGRAGRQRDCGAANQKAEGQSLDAEEIFGRKRFFPGESCGNPLVAGEADCFFPQEPMDNGGEFPEKKVLKHRFVSPKVSSLSIGMGRG
jgi:hypothetical protein